MQRPRARDRKRVPERPGTASLSLTRRGRLLGGGLGLLELVAHEPQAVVPERRVGEVDPDDLAELLGAARAAGAEQLEVARDERLALLEVARVDRQREQLPVGVGVDVARRRDEVRDVGPPRAIAV